MKEFFGENKINEVEKTANYEGDHTLLFLERLHNPEVNRKLVESLTQEYIFRYYKSNPEKGEEDIDKIREIQKKKLDERIEKVFNSTGVNLKEKNNPGYGYLNETGSVCPLVEAKKIDIEQEGFLSKKQLNLIESHEKGHGIRHFNEDSPIGKSIKDSLDFSQVVIDEKDLNLLRTRSKIKDNKDEAIIGFYLDGLRNSPDEIIERMAQLRNYFGMKGNEEFTKEHIVYAKENYIKDIGMSVQIKPFLDAITENSEKNFLYVINNIGV